MNIDAGIASDSWQHLSSPLQHRIAALLDEYASQLEAGDEQAAERVLAAQPHLRRHLSGHLQSLQVLCRASHRPDDEAPERIDEGDQPPFRVLGDYRIEREIGRGGMGIVYEATQLSLRRSVALKVLPFAAVLDQQQVTRFRNEAQAAASLHHPHIVPVFAVGCERGVHYYSMQLIDGHTLEQTLKEVMSRGSATAGPQPYRRGSPLSETIAPRAPQPPSTDDSTHAAMSASDSTLQTVRNRDFIRTTVELVIKVAGALEYAHQQGVIHRDIKPSNLLVDGAGKIWVADFGLARCRGVGNLTAQGNLMGTARYMSPEQIAGRSAEIDHRTDIYALGITLYELLTLKPAFAATTREALFKEIESSEPVSPRRWNPAISIDLETIVLKAIAKRKDDRYSTAEEFAEDLRRYLDGRPTLARRPTPIDRAFKWAIRRQRVVCSSLAILLVAVLGLAAATLTISRQSSLKDQAHAEARFYLDRAQVAVDRFGGIISAELANLPGGERLRAKVLREVEGYYLDFIRYAQTDPVLRSDVARIQFRLGAIYAQLGNVSAAEKKYHASIDTYAALRRHDAGNPDYRAELALCLHNLAALHKDQGQYTAAIARYGQAIALQQPLIQSGDVEREWIYQWAATQTNLGTLLSACDEGEQALRQLEAVRTTLEQQLDIPPVDGLALQHLVECRNALVAVLLDDDPARAEALLRSNIAELAEKHELLASRVSPSLGRLPQPELQRTVAENNLASLLGRQGKHTEAIKLARLAIATLETAQAERGRRADVAEQLAIAKNNLGQLLWNQRPNPQSADIFAEAETAFRSELGRAHPRPDTLSRLAGVLHNLGVVDQHDGQLESAVQHLVEAIELQASAIRQAPFNQGYRRYLELHRDLLDQLVHQIQQQSTSDHSRKDMARSSPDVSSKLEQPASDTEDLNGSS